MSRIRIAMFVLGIAASCLAANQESSRSLYRDSTIVSQWRDKSVDVVAKEVDGLGYASSGNATISGAWGSEIWSISKSKRKPNVPFKFLVLTHLSPAASQNGSVVSDVLVFNGEKGDLLLVHECLTKDKLPVSAVVKSKAGRFGEVTAAWQADTVKGVFAPFEPRSVRCVSEQDMAE